MSKTGLQHNRAGVGYDIQPAEVIKVNYKDDNPNQLYSITVRPAFEFSSNDSNNLVTARPFDINTKTIPLIGEVVSLIRGPHAGSSFFSIASEFYYIGNYSVQSQIHHNAIKQITKTYPKDDKISSKTYNDVSLGVPNISKKEAKKEQEINLAKSVEEKDRIQPIQPFAGDHIIEGRFGQSIRMTSTVRTGTDEYSQVPSWKEGKSNISSPMMIIRNGQRQDVNVDRSNRYFVEDINKELASIWLTNDQEIPFQPNYNNFDSAVRLNIDTFISQSPKYTGNQILLSAKDRVLITSRDKEVVVDSGGGVSISTRKSVSFDVEDEFEINAQNRINIGLDSTEPLLLGDTTGDWLNELLTNLIELTSAMAREMHGTGTGPTTTPSEAGTYIAKGTEFRKLRAKIPQLKSLLAFTKRQN